MRKSMMNQSVSVPIITLFFSLLPANLVIWSSIRISASITNSFKSMKNTQTANLVVISRKPHWMITQCIQPPEQIPTIIFENKPWQHKIWSKIFRWFCISPLWISPPKPLGWVLGNQRHYRLRANVHDQRKTTKTTTHIGSYAHSYTNKTYQKKTDIYIHPYSLTQLINKKQQS